MKKILLFILLFNVLSVRSQEEDNVFILSDRNLHTQVLSEMNLTKDASLVIDTLGTVSGFAVSGDVRFDNEYDSYIRITVEDKKGLEYLVFESYPMLSGQKSFSIEKTAYESILLDNVELKHLRICLYNTKIRLNAFHYTGFQKNEKYGVEESRIITAQAKEMADKLNVNLTSNGKLWRAGKTDVSDLTYEEKKSMFGNPVPCMYGFEFYVGGIFDIPNPERNVHQVASNTSSLCVEEWDWRDRHGKNWMTPVKNQGGCGSCWAFAAVGTLESYINLYYNQSLNYNLSEQELVSCSGAGSCAFGGNARNSMPYIEQNGIVTEDCFPYVASDVNCNGKCSNPSEVISVDTHVNFSSTSISEDSLKHLLFRAPIGMSVTSWGHAIVWAGYKIVHAGDTLSIPESNTTPFIVPDSSIYIGQTAWLIKNSWGRNTSWGAGGYGYIIVNLTNTRNAFYLSGKIHSNLLSDDDILCEDADGDGFYFWGIGSKPSSCPSWVPDEPDGDDSDYTKGPIDGYGWLRDLNPDNDDTLYIDEDTTWNTYKYQYQHVCVRNNATLSVCNTVKCYRDVSITIQPNATLSVNGGAIEDADIKPQAGGNVRIQNNGRIIPCTNKNFSIPLGAKMRIDYGRLK